MLISILVLPQFVGISALLIGLALQNISVTIINIFKLKKILHNEISVSSLIIKFSIVSFISGYLNKFIFALIGNSLNVLLSLIIFSILNVVSFIILSYCFNIFNFQLLLQLKNNARKV